MRQSNTLWACVTERKQEHVVAMGDDEHLVNSRQMARHVCEWIEVCSECVVICPATQTVTGSPSAWRR